MSGAEIIAKVLKKAGVRRVFVFPGGTIAPLIDALIKEKIELFCAINEQGAGYAAIGAAKTSGETQVVIVTSGPGATNVLTPVADAYYDSVPLLVLTGQVGTGSINYKKKVRQTGFQETDTVGIFKSITKKSFILTFSDNISKAIASAFEYTITSRPGPVLIDLPMDVQKSENKYYPIKSERIELTQDVRIRTFREFNKYISTAKRPLILSGNGVNISQTHKYLRMFAEKFNIPVVSTLPGVGAMPSNHPLYFSFVGHTGEYFANLAMYYSDLLIVFGARLDLRQTGSEIEHFKISKKIIRVDIDESEIKFGRVKADLNFNNDLFEFFKSYFKKSYKIKAKTIDWIKKINYWKKKFHSSQFFKIYSLSSYDIIRSVDKITKYKNVIVSSGVGSHQQYVPRFFTFNHPRRIWMTSAGHGTMGFDIPAIVGAVLEKKNTVGIVFVGDGSFQMNIQELATIKEKNLPIKIFVMDNKRLGIVSQFQLLTLGSDPTTGDKKNPSFSKIAEAYGLRNYEIYKKAEINSIVEKMFSDMSPALVHCHIDPCEDVLPMLLAGQKLNEMYPFKGEVS